MLAFQWRSASPRRCSTACDGSPMTAGVWLVSRSRAILCCGSRIGFSTSGDRSICCRIGSGILSAAEVKDEIFARYQTEAVRCFAGKLEELPPERLTMGAGYRMDRVTQVLATHIGDARTGKWRDLPARVQHRTHPLLPAFSRPVWLRQLRPAPIASQRQAVTVHSPKKVRGNESSRGALAGPDMAAIEESASSRLSFQSRPA